MAGIRWYPLKALRVQGEQCRSVALSLDGTLLAYGSDHGIIHVCQVADGTLLNVLTGPRTEVMSLAFSKDGTKLVSGWWDRTVRIWAVEPVQ